MTKTELYRIAKTLNIPGRSKMDKSALEAAITKAQSQADAAPIRSLLVDTIVTQQVKARIPERSATPASRGKAPEPKDTNHLTLATLVALVERGCADQMTRYARPGRKLDEPKTNAEYSLSGHRVDPCYSVDGDPSPVVFDTLVSAGEMLDAGYTFGMGETRFRESTDGAMKRLIQTVQDAGDAAYDSAFQAAMEETGGWYKKSRQMARSAAREAAQAAMSDYHGEATTVGSMGNNRYASIREMLTDAMVGHTVADYRVTDDTVTLENIQAAMCLKTLEVDNPNNPWSRLAAAYQRARLYTWAEMAGNEYAIIEAKGNHCSHVRCYIGELMEESGKSRRLHSANGFEHEVETLVLEREAVIEDLAAKMDLEDRNDLDYQDFSEWMGLWEKTSYEVARGEMKAYRDALVDKQRGHFTTALDWMFRTPASKVRKVFSYPNGAFHKGKMAKVDGEAKYSSDQRVILDAAAALYTGRKVSEKQAEIYRTAMLSSQWEAWMAFGCKADFDPTDPDTPEGPEPTGTDDNPFAPTGGGLPSRSNSKGREATPNRATVIRRPRSERSPEQLFSYNVNQLFSYYGPNTYWHAALAILESQGNDEDFRWLARQAWVDMLATERAKATNQADGPVSTEPPSDAE